MIYFIVITSIVLYFYIVRFKENDKINFFVYFMPIAVILIILLGFQNDVGTDYYSYINLADRASTSMKYKNDGEILFHYFLEICRHFNFPQLIFIISGTIQVFFLALITFDIKRMGYKLYNFYFLYFTLSLVFFNQFNGIRQYISVYICIYAILKLKENKKIYYCILVFIAGLFHRSALFLLLLVIIERILKRKIDKKIIFYLIICIFLIRFINISHIIDTILTFIPKYSNYIGVDYAKPMSFFTIFPKLLKLIVVFYCIYKIKYEDINNNDVYMLNMGYLAVFLMIASFSSGVFWRMYQYFDFFIIFPVLIYMNNYKYNKRYINIYMYLYLAEMLLIKILIFPKAEYLYSSILFK